MAGFDGPAGLTLTGLACCLLLFSLAACNRDLALAPTPQPPGPGSISGRAMVSLPGRTQRLPAAGAEVTLMGTGRTVGCDANGNFLIDGITTTAGQLLFRYDSDGNHAVDRQKLLSLEALQAGPGKQLSVGDVLLVENARMHGRVLRADLTTPSGHAGSLAFVPEGPFTALAADDGTFAFDEMPDGVVRLAFFRAGYAPDGFSEVTLISGQDLTLRDVVLQPLPSGPVDPARLTGRVVMVPSGDPALSAARLTELGGMMTSAAVASDGTFAFTQTPGLYTLTVSQPGFLTARVPNLLLQGGELPLGDVALIAGTEGSGGGAGGGGGGAGGGGFGGFGGSGGLAPVAVVNAGTAVRLGDALARLDGTKSYDPKDGGPLIFHWREETDAGVVLSANDSLLASTPNFSAPRAVATLRFQLTVTSQSGATSAPVHTQLEVVAPPSAKVLPNPLTLPAGATATLSAAMSSDPTGAPLTWAWSVLSGAVTLSATTGPTVNVTAPATAGAAMVQVVVSNPAVSADPVKVPITIAAMGSGPAAVTVGPGTSQQVGWGDPVGISAHAASAIAGEGFTYQWTQTQGPPVVLTGASTPNVGFNAPAASTLFEFNVSAVGDAGSVGSALAQVQVDDDDPPVLSASDPSDTAGAPGGWWSLTATFNEPLDATSVSTSTVHLRQGTAELPIEARYEGQSRTVRVVPQKPLTPGAAYTLELNGLADVSARHNVFPSKSLSFNARSPRFTPWRRTSLGPSSTPIAPGIAVTSSAVWVLGYWQAATSTFIASVPNLADGGVLAEENLGGGTSSLPSGRRGHVIGDAALYVEQFTAQVFGQYRQGSWATMASNGTRNVCTDGNSLAGIGESYGPHYLVWGSPTSGATEIFYDNYQVAGMTWSTPSGEEGYSCALGPNRQFMVVPTTDPPAMLTRTLRVYLKNGSGPFTLLDPRFSNTARYARSVFINDTPLLCFSVTGMINQLQCALFPGTPGASVQANDIAPGNVAAIDLTNRGGAAWLSYISGTQLKVASVWGQADAGTLDVTGLNGMTGNPSWNQNPSCAASSPEAFAAPDGLYVVWQETCGTTYDLFLRKVE
ncbi:MAG: Ig-like domain-containing protein [Archangiaceae bacterium]|nr:Ig-like domain-containing protein [Archangiaceae bacterium]